MAPSSIIVEYLKIEKPVSPGVWSLLVYIYWAQHTKKSRPTDRPEAIYGRSVRGGRGENSTKSSITGKFLLTSLENCCRQHFCRLTHGGVNGTFLERSYDGLITYQRR